MVKEHLDPAVFEYDFEFTTGIFHAHDLAVAAVGEYDTIVAVGGDGTVNEIASGIAETETELAVIPFGSGNGLARFLGIPMDTVGAIKNMNTGRSIVIDAGKMNDQWFFNMAGMGFDAHISHVFAQGGDKRGFVNYFKSSVQEIANYRSQEYHIEVDGQALDREAFMLSIANSSQYGNNAHVSPTASVQDGLLDVCVIKPFPLWRFPEMGLRMFTKTADKSKYVEIIKGKHVHITRVKPGPIHLDGEPQSADVDIRIDVVPSALKVIVGSSYHNN